MTARVYGGPTWTVVSRNDGDTAALDAGNRVGLTWSPEHTVALR